MNSLKINFTLLLSILFYSLSFTQTTYFVDQQNGKNSNNGTTLSTAFNSIDKAIGNVKPGDIIEIVGTYKNPSYNSNYSYNSESDSHLWHSENTIRINNLNGSANNFITLKAHNSNTVLKGDGANIFRITNSTYLKIEDFNIEGEVENIPLSTANKLQFVYIIDDHNLAGSTTNPKASDIRFRNEDETNDSDNFVEETDTYTDISNKKVIRPSYIDTRGLYISNSSNIIIHNNTIHHTPGGGLRVSDGKHITITENEIYRCSVKSYSGTHALVVTKTQPIASSNYSVEILRNKIHHNYNEQYSWSPSKTIITPRIDEGKGISLQRNNLSDWINGKGRILVANNLCYWNGFSGVHTNDGYRIDFINNTCYLNSYTNSITYSEQTQKGQNIGISAQSSNDIKMINNISVIDTDWGGFALSAGGTSNLEVNNNIIFGYNGTVSEDSDVKNVDVNTLKTNPMFVNTPDHLLESQYDFNLKNNSPAIGIALTSFTPSDDFFGNIRDSSPDLGAIEYSSNLSAEGITVQNISIYPNPFIDKITVNVSALKLKNISIFNLLGQKQLLKYASSENKISLDLSHLKKGVYILKIGSNRKKIIKN